MLSFAPYANFSAYEKIKQVLNLEIVSSDPMIPDNKLEDYWSSDKETEGNNF